MKKNIINILGLILLILSIGISGCSDDQCEDNRYKSRPYSLNFAIVDTSTGNNIYENNETPQVYLTNSEGYKLEIIAEHNTYEGYIFSTYTGMNNVGYEKRNYILQVNDHEYPFIFHTEDKTNGCYTLLGAKEELSSTSFIIQDEYNNNKNIYTFKIVLK